MKKVILSVVTVFSLSFLFGQHMAETGTSYSGDIYHTGGDVGIGTSNPRTGYALDVRGGNIVVSDGTDQGAISFRSDRDDSKIFESGYRVTMQSANGLSFDYDANGASGGTFEIKENGTVKAIMELGGNFGIGTSNPDHVLDVHGDAEFGTNNGIRIYDDGGTSTIAAQTNNFRLETTRDVDDIVLNVNNAEAMRIDATNGNIGIGIMAPTALLDVSGTFNVGSRSLPSTVQSQITSDRAAALCVITDDSDWNYGIKAVVDRAESKAFAIARVQGDDYTNLPTTEDVYYVTGDGKVRCKEVEVTMVGWSDFVFDDNYKLRELSEVEEFINLNKHLPDVPSEKEVIENGTNLGEMDAILLQKIEELTLYVIQLEKQLSQFSKSHE